MKKIKTILALTLLTLVTSCSPNKGEPFDPENHTCVFDQKVTTIRYRASGATCGHGALYYYSCICGAVGTETFENTDSNTPPHQAHLTIEGSYRTSYIIGEKFSTENMSATLTCLNCDLNVTIPSEDLICSDEELTEEDVSVEVGYEYEGTLYTTTVPIVVSIFSVNKVELVNKSNNVFYQLTGSYKDSFKQNILESKFFLTTLGDYVTHGGYITPTCTDKNNGTGEFFVEVDVTNIGAVTTLGGESAKHYYPHLQIKTESGVLVNQDVAFSNVQETSIDIGNDSYHLYNFYETNKKINIPTVCRTNKDSTPSSVGYINSQTQNTFPSTFKSEVGYMPTGADLINVNGEVVLRISGIHRGFISAGQFIRSFILYVYESYYKSGASSTTTPTPKEYIGGESAYNFGDWGWNSDGTFFVDVTISKFGFDLMEVNGTAGADGTTTPKKGVRYFRMGGKTGETNDIKIVDESTNGKSLVKDGYKYTLIAKTTGSDTFSNCWQCVGFNVTKA